MVKASCNSVVIFGRRAEKSGRSFCEMKTMPTSMPIDLASVDWFYVVVLAVFVFISTIIGSLLSFSHRLTAAVLSAVIFSGLFVLWTYYPHNVPFLPTTLTLNKGSVAPAAPPPAATPNVPEKPRNPVTDITPPANPQR